MRKSGLSALFLIAALSGFAQMPKQLSAGEIVQSMKKLEVTGSVLYVAAHPDDENTRLLAYLANGKKLRTGYLSLTRGDGGQNLIGKEQGEPLGVIRTQELLAARRTDGAEQFFTRANDFGFSKNPNETFSIWNKEIVLSDVVLAIRKFKPDVIICRFPTTGEGGHGHHTASAILAVEAFDAAADPKRFPEQLAYTEVWQAKRIFWNTFNFGTTNTTAPNQLKMDVGVFNPLLGKSYGEIASESRSMHKSQGFGSARQRGVNLEYFKLLKGDSAHNDVMDGVNTGWNRFKGTEKIQKALAQCVSGFNPQAPENSVAALVSVYKLIQALDEKDRHLAYWKKQKLTETEDLIMSCSGLWLEATATDYTGIPGRETGVTVQVVNRSRKPVLLRGISYSAQSDTSMSLDLKYNELYTFKRKINPVNETTFSNPYWLNEAHEPGLYTVNASSLIGQAENSAFAYVRFTVFTEGFDFSIKRPLAYKYTDPVKGEIYRPFEMLPPATVNIPEKVFVFADQKPKVIRLIIKANAAGIEGTLDLKVSGPMKVDYNNTFKLANKGDEAVIDATVTPQAGTGEGKLEASLQIGGQTYKKSIKRIEYDHIPYQFILSDASAGLVMLDLKKTVLDIGYIPGAGDDIPSSLQQAGFNVTVLNDDALLKEDLSRYNAIVTGIRAYNTNDRLQVHYSKLMEYVNAGGNLVVQYNTNNRIGPVLAKMGPYPFTISRDRVTDEKATVRFLNEKHPALNYPNQITPADFDGWVQERGIYFATEVDKNYESVFSMNDPEEKASDGSLIVAKYGKGNFVYTGLAFFRELPAGVPGAYRLFVNLLSLPKNK